MKLKTGAPPSRESVVNLREVNVDTMREISALAVAEAQSTYVAPNVYSIAEAYFHPEAWFRAIYADNTPVGFAMLEDWSLVPDADPAAPICLWRFMIDHRYQGLGFGGRALMLIVEHVRTRTDLGYMLTSYVPGDGSPGDFYLKFGFTPTGEEMDCEIVLRLDLQGMIPRNPNRT